MPLLDYAARLVAEACSSGCARGACKRLRRALDALSRAAEGPGGAAAGGLGVRVQASILAGLLEAAAWEAAREGCAGEAALLMEASRVLSGALA